MELTGGVAIVTGAGGAIGSAIARRLSEESMLLVLADRSADTLEAAVTELSASTTVVGCVGDVADAEFNADLVTQAARLGQLKLSVLNAGLYLPGLTWELSDEQWQLHIDVNLWGVLNGVRAAIPTMMDQGAGHIVALASGAGLVATPALGAYVATKHAVVGTMESLYHELARVAPEVHASVVCPGNVVSSMATNSQAAAGMVDEQLGEVATAVAKLMRAGNAAGQDPSTVADAIVDAVREQRFWVLPQPEVGWAALDRAQRIVDGREPVDLLG